MTARSTTTAKTATLRARGDQQADPPGPNSLPWKYFGDLRTGMLGVWIGAIQNMYPELGAGVEDHSILLREPLQRVARSVYPIMGVVYDGERAALTGAQIRRYHTTIKGVDAAGRRYHALNPETFYWAHATFFMLVLKTAEYFCGGHTEAGKPQLFVERVRWDPAAGPQKLGEIPGLLGPGVPRRARYQPRLPRHFLYPHSQAVVRAD